MGRGQTRIWRIFADLFFKFIRVNPRPIFFGFSVQTDSNS